MSSTSEFYKSNCATCGTIEHVYCMDCHDYFYEGHYTRCDLMEDTEHVGHLVKRQQDVAVEPRPRNVIPRHPNRKGARWTLGLDSFEKIPRPYTRPEFKGDRYAAYDT